MDLFLKLLFILTYTDAPTEDGRFEPSNLLRLIGGWDDIEQVDDAALHPAGEVPAGPCKALEKLRMAEAADPRDEGDDFTRLRKMVGEDREWDQEFVERMMKRYERMFELLDEMMEEPEIRIAVPKFGYFGPNDIWSVVGLSRPYRLRTRMSRERGDWAAAVDSLHDMNRLSNFVLESPGPLITFLVGMALERDMLATAEAMLNHRELPPEHMPRIREILADGPNRTACLTRTWKNEYLFQKEMTQAVGRGLTITWLDIWVQIMGEEPSMLDEVRAVASRCGQQLALAFGFQTNRAVALCASMSEHAIAQTGLTFAQRANVEPPPLLSKERSWTEYIHSNGYAEFTLRGGTTSTLKALDRADLIEANRQALLAVWGVRRFHQEHFRLPETLRELVPEHLAQVPRDPYDGASVKYSAKDRRVWVVGEDLADDGGAEDSRYRFRSSGSPFRDEEKGYDPTLFLKWLGAGEAPAP